MARTSAAKGILASYLKHKRMLRGLSQGEVASELGYSSAQFISNWERGMSSPPGNIIPRLAALLHIPEKEFVVVLLKEQEAIYWSLFQNSAKERRKKKISEK